MTKIPVGISACLLGEAVRFNGSDKRDAYINGTLSRYFEFHPFCPEVEIGLGVPRAPIHLVRKSGKTHCVGVTDPDRDVTQQLQDQADAQRPLQAGWCGCILKKDSPSCGMQRVKVYTGDVPERKGVGIYAEQMMQNNPILPVEEEGRLGDPQLRENFIQRVYVLYRWKMLENQGISIERLSDFHARHKLIIMSRCDYRDLGRLLANAKNADIASVAEQYILQLMTVLKKVATRNQHVNVLQHIQGYLKKELSSDDKAELCEIIERYRIGELPLIVPLTLLRHHFRKCPDTYIDNSYYMTPYPQELQLVNQL